MFNRFLWLLITVIGFLPNALFACACGCGVFDVQPGTMFPSGEGGTVWTEYDFMNQNVNWSRTASSLSSNNDDKVIRTNFISVGGEYMFNREWGVLANFQYWDRYFKTTDDSGSVASFNHDSIGDTKIEGVYTGLSPDMSTGITFGLKLPTGDYSYANFDRDTEIGTGSTDLLLGAYHLGSLTSDGSWGWFADGELDQPFMITAGYRPGSEVDGSAGVYYDKWSVAGVKIQPVAQVIGSYRLSDRGPAADPDNTGYKRVYLSPGLELAKGSWTLFTDVALPVFQDMTGNQLTAPVLFKVNVSYSF